MSDKKSDSDKSQLVERRVLTDTHQHEGQPCKKGDKIWVSKDVAKLLDEMKVTEPVK